LTKLTQIGKNIVALRNQQADYLFSIVLIQGLL